jgi:hypothetical protein
MENRPLSALVEHLQAQTRVWLRLAVSRPESDWQLSLLEVTLGEPPASWRRQRWLYPRAAFIASMPAGTTVAKWLQGKRLSLRGVALDLDLLDSVYVERRDSRFKGIFEALPWPTRDWTAHVNGQSKQVVHDELVAADAPAFFSFDQAAAAFFGLPPAPNRNFSGRELVIREQDRRARIDSVRVRPTEVLVTVSGEALSGTWLTLGGDGGAKKRLASRTREVRLPVPSGLGAGAWLALHRDQELLDRRMLDTSWGGKDFDVEVDRLTRVEVLIGGGEGVSVEFKRQLPGADARGVMKTLAAFANGGGGTLLFGVDNDGDPVGLGAQCTRENVDRLTNLIAEWVRPHVHFTLAEVEAAGARVLVIDVAPGGEPPYGVGTSDRKLVYYIRVGATTFPASPAEVRAIVRSRLPSDRDPRFPLPRRSR